MVEIYLGGSGEDKFPFETIADDSKREEFRRDHDRLIYRCGHNAMLSTFMLYMLEQKIGAGEHAPGSSEQTPRIRNVGHKNTAEIIARFVENGWMDYYLARDDFGPKEPLMLNIGGGVMVSQKDGGRKVPTAAILIKNPVSRLLRGFVARHYEEKVEGATLIPPDKIREIFAEIDSKYEPNLVREAKAS